MAKSERRKLLEEKMKEINKKNKDKSFIKFAENKDDTEYTSFGVPEIDKFTGGGAKKGHITVIYGPKSCGKTTLALQMIADAQSKNLICCLIDKEHGWDKDRAVNFGVNLNNLLLVETSQTAEQDMDIINELAKEKLVDLVLLDSINALSPEAEQQTKKGKIKSIADDTMALLARKLGQFFRIVAPHVYRGKISVVLIGQVRTHGIGSFYTYAGLSGGNALEQWMSTCLFIRQGQKSDAPQEKKKIEIKTPDGEVHKKTVNEQIGFDCVIRMDKRRNSESMKEGSDIHLPFYYHTGFHPPLNVANPYIKDEKSLRNAVETSTAIEGVHPFKKEDNKLEESLLKKELAVIKEDRSIENVPVKPKKRGRPKKLKGNNEN